MSYTKVGTKINLTEWILSWLKQFWQNVADVIDANLLGCLSLINLQRTLRD